ncbi:hypothetical protein L7F22_060262, partial [Adiantum nelumboides]|nr:hypothetical protein [Adiantum nelumboides]
TNVHDVEDIQMMDDDVLPIAHEILAESKLVRDEVEVSKSHNPSKPLASIPVNEEKSPSKIPCIAEAFAAARNARKRKVISGGARGDHNERLDAANESKSAKEKDYVVLAGDTSALKKEELGPLVCNCWRWVKPVGLKGVLKIMSTLRHISFAHKVRTGKELVLVIQSLAIFPPVQSDEYADLGVVPHEASVGLGANDDGGGDAPGKEGTASGWTRWKDVPMPFPLGMQADPLMKDMPPLTILSQKNVAKFPRLGNFSLNELDNVGIAVALNQANTLTHYQEACRKRDAMQGNGHQNEGAMSIIQFVTKQLAQAKDPVGELQSSGVGSADVERETARVFKLEMTLEALQAKVVDDDCSSELLELNREIEMMDKIIPILKARVEFVNAMKCNQFICRFQPPKCHHLKQSYRRCLIAAVHVACSYAIKGDLNAKVISKEFEGGATISARFDKEENCNVEGGARGHRNERLDAANESKSAKEKDYVVVAGDTGALKKEEHGPLGCNCWRWVKPVGLKGVLKIMSTLRHISFAHKVRTGKKLVLVIQSLAIFSPVQSDEYADLGVVPHEASVGLGANDDGGGDAPGKEGTASGWTQWKDVPMPFPLGMQADPLMKDMPPLTILSQKELVLDMNGVLLRRYPYLHIPDQQIKVLEAPSGLEDEILSTDLGQGSVLEIDEALASKENNLQIVMWNIQEEIGASTDLEDEQKIFMHRATDILSACHMHSCFDCPPIPLCRLIPYARVKVLRSDVSGLKAAFGKEG